MRDLLAPVAGTVGVVAPHGRVAAGPRRCCRSDPRLTVVDPWQVKGLEYDGCLVADPHGIVAEAQHPVAGLRSLYVALTRATQRLVVLSTEPLETLLERLSGLVPSRSRRRRRRCAHLEAVGQVRLLMAAFSTSASRARVAARVAAAFIVRAWPWPRPRRARR